MTIRFFADFLGASLFMGHSMRRWRSEHARRQDQASVRKELAGRVLDCSKGWLDTNAAIQGRSSTRALDGSQDGFRPSKSCRSWPGEGRLGVDLISDDHSYLLVSVFEIRRDSRRPKIRPWAGEKSAKRRVLSQQGPEANAWMTPKASLR